MCKLLSGICCILFLATALACTYLALQEEYAVSMSFGILSVLNFGLMVIFGYVGLKDD